MSPLGLLDLVAEDGRWSLYLGTWRIAHGLTLIAALRLAGFNVISAH